MASDAREDSRLVLRIFTAAYGALVAVAVAADYLLYADGSYFAFSLASGHPWQLLWRDFPLRLGTLLPTGVPAALLATTGAPTWLVTKVYELTFLAFPLIALALTRKLEPRTSVRWQLWLICAISTLCMMAFGFPTETFIAVAWLFPLLAVITNPIERSGRLAVAMVLSTAFIFSHEVAVLCAPALLCALFQSFRLGSRRRYVAILLAWWLVNWGVWYFLKHHFYPANPLLIPALAQNQQAFFNFGVLSERSLLRFGLLTAAALCWLAWRPQDWRHWFVKAAVVALAIGGAYFCLLDRYPGDRYLCRTAIALALPAIGVFAVVTKGPAPSTGWAATVFLAAQLVITGADVCGWVEYRRFLVSALEQRTTLSTGDWEALHQTALPPYAKGFHWNWTEPYLAALLLADRDAGAVMIDNETWYTPITCLSARAVLPGVSWLRRDQADQLIADACDKQPQLDAYCRGELLAGDVDGDGTVDLICRERAGGPRGKLTIAFAAVTGLSHARTWEGDLTWCTGADARLFVGDFDGDGRADLLCHHPSVGQQVIVFGRATGPFSEPEAETEISHPWCSGESVELLVGDFNGDGRSDVLCHDRVSGVLALRLAKVRDGRSATTLDEPRPMTAAWCNDARDELRVGDVDGDGLEDLLCHRASDGHVSVTFTRLDRTTTPAQPSFVGTDWGADLFWCNDPHDPGDEFWLHGREPDGAADMMCRSARTGFSWLAEPTRKRSAPYVNTQKTRYAAGWCYGGGGVSKGRHLIDVACVQRGRHSRH